MGARQSMVDVDPFRVDAERGQRVALRSQVLINCRNPGVADLEFGHSGSMPVSPLSPVNFTEPGLRDAVARVPLRSPRGGVGRAVGGSAFGTLRPASPESIDSESWTLRRSLAVRFYASWMSSHALVAVGSANAIKVEAVRAAAASMLGPGVRVESIATSSGAPDQPWGDAETLAGAATRAAAALSNLAGATIGVGIEAGLIDRPDHCVESVSWVVAIGVVGARRVRGQSRAASYLLPDELARQT